MKSEVIELSQYGPADKAFSFKERTISLPKANEIQIEVEQFGLNYADVMARLGLYREAPPIPCVLGYEVVGKVIHVGENAPQELVGKRVVAFTPFGGYSRHVNTKHIATVEIGDYDGGKALCLATQYVTAFYMVSRVPIMSGQHILIHAAAGGVGTALIQLLKNKDVHIIAKVGSDSKIDYLKSLGVETIINYKKSDYAEQIRTLLKGEKLSISFNPAGGSTFKKDWKLIGSNGSIILFGGSERSGKKWGILSDLNFVRKMGFVIPIALMGSSRSIIGINMLRVAEGQPKVLHHCLQEVVRLAQSNKLNPRVGETFDAKDISKAHAFLESGKSTGKIAVKWA